MSYPQGHIIRVAFTAGLGVAGAFVLMYACMISGTVTGQSAIKWNAIGTTGLIHTVLFIVMWIGGCCGWWSYKTHMIKLGVFMWALIGILMTLVGAASNGIVGTFIYYCGVTTVVHAGVFLGAGVILAM